MLEAVVTRLFGLCRCGCFGGYNKNRALKGANVGHVSLSIFDGTHETYVSLWPAMPKPHKTEKFSDIENHIRGLFSDFIECPPAYQQNYERDCAIKEYRDSL